MENQDNRKLECRWKDLVSAGTGLKKCSFLVANIECDTFGALRVPEYFHVSFGDSLKCRLGVKCRNYIWPAKYDQDLRKIYGLGSFIRYYGFGVYSIALFDYYGDGMFEVKLFRETATECDYPKQHPKDFVKTKDANDFYFDDYLIDVESLEFEKRFALFCFNGCRNTTDFVEMRILNLDLHPNVIRVKLDSSWEKFYKDWKDGNRVVLSFARSKWEVEVKWMNGSCYFTTGWVEFVKETEIQAGDVLLLHKSKKKGNTIINVCIFKAEDCATVVQDVTYEEEHSFIKIVSRAVAEDGFFFLPRLVNKKHYDKLYRMNQIDVGGDRWFIFFNERNGYIWNLEDMMQRFNVVEKDAIVFSIDDSNVLSARIYRSDGMEINYERNDRTIEDSALEHWFLKPDIELGSESSDESEFSSGSESWLSVSDEEDFVGEIDFTIKISAGLVDKRSHGVCIPNNIHPANHDWIIGDEVLIETDKGIWKLGLVMHHKRARFCSGWNKFVRENSYKVNDVLHWRLTEQEGSPKFLVRKI